MMLDDASRGRSYERMMVRHVPDYPADRRAFQTAFGAAGTGQHGKRRGNCKNSDEFVHIGGQKTTDRDKTRQDVKSCSESLPTRLSGRLRLSLCFIEW